MIAGEYTITVRRDIEAEGLENTGRVPVAYGGHCQSYGELDACS